MPLKVSIVTSTRADWGLLRPPAKLIRDDPFFEISIVASGSHLSARYGMTVNDIRRDGFDVALELPILEDSDDAGAAIRTLARMTAGFGDALQQLKPDLVMVLGDRYEILGAAQACLIARVPVAHLCGGDITEGAFDDAFRHSISKMSHLHFPSNGDAARRLIAMGEMPERVLTAGSTGLDTLREAPKLSRAETFAALELQPRRNLVLVTFHPPTLDATPGEVQFAELAAALDQTGDDTAIVITGSNSDPEGRRLTELAEEFARTRPHAVFRNSLGPLYLSVMSHAIAVAGNSSSGLYEAPSFGIGTVNIGNRQKGRLKATSVIDVAPDRAAILAGLRRAMTEDFSATQNPYGDGHAAPRIIARLKAIGDAKALINKSFYEGAQV